MQIQEGLIKIIIIIIIFLLVLSYLGINLRSIIESESFQNNWNYVREGVKYVWQSYLSNPAKYLWDKII